MCNVKDPAKREDPRYMYAFCLQEEAGWGSRGHEQKPEWAHGSHQSAQKMKV